MKNDLKIKIAIDKQTKELNQIKKEFNTLSASVTKANKDTLRFQNRIKMMGHLATGVAGLGIAFHSLSNVIKESISLYEVQEKAEAKLSATLKSTGYAAGFSAKELIDYAGELQNITTYGDEATIGMMSLLNTFKNISGDTYKRTVRAVQDMSTVMEQDLKSSAIMLGKALNDPITGLSALSRTGVQFSSSQKKTIEQLTKTNDVMGAQKIILKELESQFGGSSEAMALTYGGALTQLDNKFGDLKEKIGRTALETLMYSGALETLDGWISSISDSDMNDFLLETVKVMGFLKDVVTGVKLTLNAMEMAFLLAIRSVLEIINKPLEALDAIINGYNKLGDYLKYTKIDFRFGNVVGVESVDESIKELKKSMEQKVDELAYDSGQRAAEIFERTSKQGYEKNKKSLGEQIEKLRQMRQVMEQAKTGNTKLANDELRETTEQNAKLLSLKKSYLTDTKNYTALNALEINALEEQMTKAGIQTKSALWNTYLENLKNKQLQAFKARQEAEIKTKIEDYEKSQNPYLTMLDTQKELIESTNSWGDALTGNFKKVEDLASALTKMRADELTSLKAQKVAEIEFNKQKIALKEKGLDTTEIEKQYAKSLMRIHQQDQKNQIDGYANIAGAIGSMMKEGSDGANAMMTIQSALAMVNAVNAVLQQGTGDPYTAFARMAAMVATAGSLLSNIGKTFKFSKEHVSKDGFAAMTENTGTGTTLGDAQAQSASIENSLGILENYAKPQYSILSKMYKSVANIENKIAGLSGLIYQNGGFSAGEGFEQKSYLNGGTLGEYGMTGLSFALSVDQVLDKVTGDNSLAKILTGAGSVSKMGEEVQRFFWGKTNVSLSDAGAYFKEQNLYNALDRLQGQAYQVVKTNTKSFWHNKTSYNTAFGELNEEVGGQFQLLLNNLYSGVVSAGEALGTSTGTIENNLKDFVVSIGKISLKDKTAKEIQEQLTAVFGQIGDKMGKTAFPALVEFQKVGEGLFETLTRVATGMSEADYYIGNLGYTKISYENISNKQADDIGRETLYESILKHENGGVANFENNFTRILEAITGTTEELYNTYVTLDDIRDKLAFLNLDINGLSTSMITGAGGIDTLNSSFNTYFKNYLSSEEQYQYKLADMQKQFDKLGLQMPQSTMAFRQLLESIDLSTNSGQELYGRMIKLSGSFVDVTNAAISSIESLYNSQMSLYSALGRDTAELQKGLLYEKAMELSAGNIGKIKYNEQGIKNSVDFFKYRPGEAIQKLRDGSMTQDFYDAIVKIIAFENQSSSANNAHYTPSYATSYKSSSTSLFTDELDKFIEALSQSTSSLANVFTTAKSTIDSLHSKDKEYSKNQYSFYMDRVKSLTAQVSSNPNDTELVERYENLVSSASKYTSDYIKAENFDTKWEYEVTRDKARNDWSEVKQASSVETKMGQLLDEIKELKEVAKTQAGINKTLKDGVIRLQKIVESKYREEQRSGTYDS